MRGVARQTLKKKGWQPWARGQTFLETSSVPSLAESGYADLIRSFQSFVADAGLRTDERELLDNSVVEFFNHQ